MPLTIVLSGHGEVKTNVNINVPANTGIKFWINQGIALRDRVGGLVEDDPNGNHGHPPDQVRPRLQGGLIKEHIMYDPRHPNLDIHKTPTGAGLQFLAPRNRSYKLSEFLAWIDGKRAALVAANLLNGMNDTINIHWAACRVVAGRIPVERLGIGMRLVLCNQDFGTVANLGVLSPSPYEFGILRGN